MITMAESRQTFKMYHYQQVRKEPKEHIANADSEREHPISTYNAKGNSDKYLG